MRGKKSIAWLVILAAAAAVTSWSASLTADQGGDDKSFEKSLDVGLRDIINLGATLFNGQDDHAGCYRLFEGALRTTKPLLGKYPDVQRKIDTSLAEAAKLPRMHDRAHALRKALDEVRATINPSIRPVAKSLWDRLGGAKGVDKVLSDFIAAAANDPKVDVSRGGKFTLTPPQVQVLQKSLFDYISEVAGGPYKYNGPSMKVVHKGMGITDEQFDAAGGHLKSALERNGVAAADVSAVLAAVAGARGDIVEPPVKKAEDKPPDPPIKKIDILPPDPPIKKSEDKSSAKQPEPDPNLARVRGTVSFGGQPLTYGFVTFVNAAGQRYSANVKKDGTYIFRKGFPAGDYVVVIEDDTSPPGFGDFRIPIPPDYMDPVRSSLRFNAAKGESAFNIMAK